jgi:WD40 repeat protein
MWLQKTRAGVVSMTFSPDGRVLYVLDTRGEITAWDAVARTPRTLYRIGATPDIRLPDARLDVACDGRFLVVFLRSAVHVWDGASGVEHARLPHEPTGYIPSLDPARRLLVSSDPQWEVLTAWDIVTRSPTAPYFRARLPNPTRFIHFAMTADGGTVAVQTARREIDVYDRASGRAVSRFAPFATIGPTLGLAFSADGKMLALLGLDHVTVWDVPAQSIREKRVRCPMPVYLWAVHPALPVIATRNSDRHITLFSLETGERLRSFDFTMGTSSLNCVTFSPDGLTCAVGGSNKQFAVFDVDL